MRYRRPMSSVESETNEAPIDESGQATPRSESGLAAVLPFPSLGNRPTGSTPPQRQPTFRDVLGEVLRDERLGQNRTLADVASSAAVSLPYLSEVERGRKEISSELLAAVSGALELPLVEVLERCVDHLRAGAQRHTSIQLRAA